jgi:hypothetical protein
MSYKKELKKSQNDLIIRDKDSITFEKKIRENFKGG